jgi:hypothetical protein
VPDAPKLINKPRYPISSLAFWFLNWNNRKVFDGWNSRQEVNINWQIIIDENKKHFCFFSKLKSLLNIYK